MLLEILSSREQDWRTSQVLELMGGEHAGLSQEAKGLYNPQIMGPASPDTPEGNEET